MKETQSQSILPGVPKAKQGREVPQQWEWTEESVWTERMLATLVRGIKGGKWFSLMDKVYKIENLQSAMKTVVRKKGAAGVDGMTSFARDCWCCRVETILRNRRREPLALNGLTQGGLR